MIDNMTDEQAEGIVRVVLERMHEDDEWDRTPQLLVIMSQREDSLLFATVKDLGVPENVAAAHPAEWIPVVIEMAREYPDSPFHQIVGEGWSYAGVILCNEGWGLIASPDEADEAMRYAQTRSIKDHPGRKEMRLVSAVLADGRRISGREVRDDGNLEVSGGGEGVIFDNVSDVNSFMVEVHGQEVPA